MPQAKFTPTEQKIFNVLADLEAHTVEELIACLPDELGSNTNLHPHISSMRNKIAHRDLTIRSVFLNRKPRYQILGIVSPEQIQDLLHNT